VTTLPGGRAVLAIRDRVATITLRNDGKRNAIDLQMAEELVSACDRIDAGDSAAVVLRGHDGYFCSGADRRLLERAASAASAEEAGALLDPLYASFLRIGELGAPVIAAIRGGAVGAGLNVALAADLRIVAADATLISGFRERGIHHGGGQGYLVSEQAGLQAATAMIVFGQRVGGQRASELGLAWEALPDDAVEERARVLAEVVATTPALSAAMIASLRGDRMVTWRRVAAAERTWQIQTIRAAGAGATSRS
jgi:enoyl-CoA hydratase